MDSIHDIIYETDTKEELLLLKILFKGYGFFFCYYYTSHYPLFSLYGLPMSYHWINKLLVHHFFVTVFIYFQHIPRINSHIPTLSDTTLDYQRLLQRYVSFSSSVEDLQEPSTIYQNISSFSSKS